MTKPTIPKTTELEPYIEFRFCKNNELKLSKTSSWWGGKKGGFHSIDGGRGNTCLPKDLDLFIKHFIEKEGEKIDKKINKLNKEKIKLKANKYDK